MHFVILGCGRVGSMLAWRTVSDGHSVAVIDQNPASFVRLGTDFPGTTVTGIGFDRSTLESAGIREAAGFAAVSSGDNSNVIAARVVREEYGLRHVVARIYDPRRAEVYERLGIATVATVRWTTDQVMSRLIPGAPSREYQDVSGRLSMVSLDTDASWVGSLLADLERRTGARVAYLTRWGDGVLPGPETRLQDGDRLHLMVATEERARVETMLAHRKDEERAR